MSSRLPVLLACWSLILAAGALQAQPYVFSTMAGSSSQGYADGKMHEARFALPQFIAVGPGGHLYIADYGNSVIRKVAPDGTVTTVAGTPGVAVHKDGAIAEALFATPIGIAVDASGNIYVSDSGSAVRVISTTGSVYTLAGAMHEYGNVDASQLEARFGDARGLAVDSAGNIYVADMGNCTVRRVSRTGVVTTIAGVAGKAGHVDGPGATAEFRAPYAVAVDKSGNVYVADWDDATIRKIDVNRNVTTVVGQGSNPGSADGQGVSARIDTPTALAVDATGNLYITDGMAAQVRKFSTTGWVSALAGGAYDFGHLDGTGTAARFNFPMGIAVDTSGNVYVSDSENGAIRKITATGVVTTLAGMSDRTGEDGVRTAARFFSPLLLTSDAAGNMYITERENHTVRKLTPDGTVTTVAGAAGIRGSVDGTVATARFNAPTGIAVDSAGNLYVADSENHTIRKITATGIVGTFAGKAGSSGHDDGTNADARFWYPGGMVIDPEGNLILADTGNHALRKITPAGTVTTLAGRAGLSGYVDGDSSQARFNFPYSVALDAQRNLYISEGNQVIRKLSPDGVVSTVAGKAGQSGDADGIGSDARFYEPAGITVAPNGNLFVSDTGNDLIRMVTPAGAVTTVGGSGYRGSSDGIEAAAEFSRPTGIISDSAGNLYIADRFNGTIRKAGLARVAEPTSRLFNMSVRANFNSRDRLIVGLVVNGGPKPILIRAVGPGLEPIIGSSNGLTTDPRIEMYDNALNLVLSNDNWEGDASLSDTFARVGAFGLPAASKDAAAIRQISGTQTVHVITPTDGLGLVEGYDAGTGVTTRLANISARYMVTKDGGPLIAGFVIEGSHQKTVLIRGVGPTLVLLGVQNALSNPRIALYNGAQQKIAENDNWSRGLSSTFSAVGAFDLMPGSKDAAMLVTLSPGLYTAQISAVGAESGEALVEIYEVGN